MDTKPRILLADNDEDVLELLKIAVERRGWVADCAISGEQLIERINTACAEGGPCYDLIVTDIRFGRTADGTIRITGIAAAKAVRDKFANLPILFLTGWSGPLTRESAAEIGNAEIVEKPFDTETLMDRFENLMSWSQGYEGQERRQTSINRTPFERRCTDRRLTVPDVLIKAINATQKAGR